MTNNPDARYLLPPLLTGLKADSIYLRDDLELLFVKHGGLWFWGVMKLENGKAVLPTKFNGPHATPREARINAWETVGPQLLESMKDRMGYAFDQWVALYSKVLA